MHVYACNTPVKDSLHAAGFSRIHLHEQKGKTERARALATRIHNDDELIRD